MRAALTAPCPATLVPGMRTFEAADVPLLGPLMHSAYLDTVDYEGETLEQSAAEVVRTVEGAYGEFVPACSQVMVHDGALRSAVLLTRFESRPFVAFTFTDPAFQRARPRAGLHANGHGRSLPTG